MDTGEMTLPNIGIIEMADPETGRRIWVDSASKRVRDTYGQWWKELITNNLNTFRRSGIDTVQLYTDRDYVPALLELFRRRNG